VLLDEPSMGLASQSVEGQNTVPILIFF